MDVYGMSTPDGRGIGIDDFLDFSNDEIFTSSTSTSTTITNNGSGNLHYHHHFPYLDKNSAGTVGYLNTLNPDYSSTTDFANDLGIPNDDVAELEWLSNFVDDSSVEFPENLITGTVNVHSETPLNSRSRSKRSRSTQWTSTYESATNQSWTTDSKDKKKEQNSILVRSRERSTSATETVPRKCTHCASEKTPQWRTGPLGPKTLCNACGVRFKSGRLVPEYRPAASPTFVLTQHSNSHRKVLELRRQKELLRQQQQQQELYGHQNRHFQVC